MCRVAPPPRRAQRTPRQIRWPRSADLLSCRRIMKPPSDDRPLGAPPDAPLAEGPEAFDDEAGLSALVAQREAFRRDVQRIEAALARGTDERFGLYERLLRCRRISGK